MLFNRKSVLIKSYAKINVGLNVFDKREDGYHDLDMIMIPIQLHDSILMKLEPGRKTSSVTLDDYSILVKGTNIVTSVINALNKYTDRKDTFRVVVHKLIPVCGGFGGGSSNAAAAAKGYCELTKTNLDNETLQNILLPLGADIPFFVPSLPMRCRGVGEKLTQISVKKKYHVLIVKPEEGCSTRQVYAAFDKETNPTKVNIDLIQKALEEGDDELLAKELNNSLTSGAISYVPEIKKVIDEMKGLGLKIVSMTGSGSGVYALSEDSKLIKKAFKHFDKKYLTIKTKVLR